MTKLEKFRATLQQSEKRLDKVCIQSQERIRIETEEDKYAVALRNWCLHVRSQILVPARETQSEISRPQFGVSLSPIMNEVIAKAQHLGISNLHDVKKMIDCFKSICWSLSALATIRQKPYISQIQYLVLEVSKFKLPDEKAVRTMKFMLNRTCQWQSKIRKSLAQKKGETKSISVSLLKELQCGIQELPLIMPEERALRIAIEDSGTRHCTCGGPSDGNFMLSCDGCNKWFHGACMQVPNSVEGEHEKNWSCPACSGIETLNSQFGTNVANSAVDTKEALVGSSIVQSKEVSPHAPDPLQLWPPFGLLGSETASEALGPAAIVPDEIANNAIVHNNVTQSDTISSSQLTVSKALNVSLEVKEKEAPDAIVPDEIANNAIVHNNVTQSDTISSSQLTVSKALNVSLEVKEKEAPDVVVTTCLSKPTKEKVTKTPDFESLQMNSNRDSQHHILNPGHDQNMNNHVPEISNQV